MTFDAYLASIKEKTGLEPRDFVALAAAKGFDTSTTKAGTIIDWLASDYGLGRGHAMAIVAVLKAAQQGGRTPDDARIDKLFSGARAKWREPVEALLARVKRFGEIGIAPTDTYLSLTRDGRKFAVLAPGAARLDIGIKLKGVAPAGRFAPAGEWNSMVTHRVRVSDPKDIDKDVLAWLKAAYAAA